jgi:hypothetical protein
MIAWFKRSDRGSYLIDNANALMPKNATRLAACDVTF